MKIQITNNLINGIQSRFINHQTQIYFDFRYCNNCGMQSNKIEVKDSINSILCECQTECLDCGFSDYWAYGYFESIQDGYKKAKMY